MVNFKLSKLALILSLIIIETGCSGQEWKNSPKEMAIVEASHKRAKLNANIALTQTFLVAIEETKLYERGFMRGVPRYRKLNKLIEVCEKGIAINVYPMDSRPELTFARQAISDDVANYMTDFCAPHLSRLSDLSNMLIDNEFEPNFDTNHWFEENKNLFGHHGDKTKKLNDLTQSLKSLSGYFESDSVFSREFSVTDIAHAYTEEMEKLLTEESLNLIMDSLTFHILLIVIRQKW